MSALRLSGLWLSVSIASMTSCRQDSPALPATEPVEVQNVLMVLIDTLRTDALSCYGSETNFTPNIDALAQKSSLFMNAYSQATRTHPSISSMLTGLYPPSNGVATQAGSLREGVQPIQRIAQANGISTGLFSANLCQLHEIEGNVFSEGWDKQYCGMNPSMEQWLWDRAVVSRAQEWIESQSSSWFAMVHMMDPHSEHQPPPQHWDRQESPFEDKQSEHARFLHFEEAYQQPAKFYVNDLRGRYAAEVRGVDEVVGQLFWWLSAREDADRTAVVLVSDHGEELFSSWPKAGHGLSLTDWVLSVPLIVSVPGRDPEIVESAVEIMQLAPTLLDLLALPEPYPLEAPGLFDAAAQRDFALSFSGNVGTITRAGERLWQHIPELDSYQDMDEVFDLMPGARFAPWYRHSAIIAEQATFRESVRNFTIIDTQGWSATASDMARFFDGALPEVLEREELDAEASPELIEQLKALGYSEADL